jgi:hypothetical protein
VAGNAAALAALRKVAQAVSELAQVPSRAASEASGSIKTILQRQFASQTDAYGRPWAPLTDATIKRWGSHPILDLTHQLKDVDVRPMTGAGIVVTLGSKSGAFHQVGTYKMKGRPILPDGPLPPAWQQAIADAATNSFTRTMGKAR